MSRAGREDAPGWAGFSPRGLAAFFVFGLSTFGLGLGLAAFSGDLFGHASCGPDTYSRSLVGHRALAELLRRTGLGVVQGRNPHGLQARPRFPLLSLEPGIVARFDLEGLEEPELLADADQEQRVTALFARAVEAHAPVVLALPKRSVRPSREFMGWIGAEELLPESAAGRPLALLVAALGAATPPEAESAGGTRPQASDPVPRLVRAQAGGGCRAERLGLGVVRVEPDGPLQLLAAGPALTPLVECQAGVLIGLLQRAAGPTAVVVADPDLLNNRGLARGDHAALVRRLLAHLDAAGVVFDETLHGHLSGQSLLARALSFPLGLVSAHAALALLLFGLCVSAPFGRPRRPPPALPPGKALLIDNTAQLLHANSDHRAALRRYLAGVLQELGRRCGALGPLAGLGSEQALIARLAALGQARGLAEDPAALARAARSPALRAPEALRLARRIHAWRGALLGQPHQPASGRRRWTPSRN